MSPFRSPFRVLQEAFFFREKNGIAYACVINFPSVLLYHGMPKYEETRPSLDFFDVERTRSNFLGSSHHILH